MFDTHVDYHHAIQHYITEDPALAFSLTQQWQYETRINESVVCKLVQTSQLHGFTGTLFIGWRISRDTALSKGVPLPHWASLITSTSATSSGGDLTAHGDEDEDDIPREVNINTDLVVQLME